MVQSDWRGGEYRPLTTFVQNLGIIHKVSCTHTPQQNGVAERKHRAIVETRLTLFAQSSIPHHFWDDAFSTSVYLINRLPTKLLQYSCPLETLYKVKPDYSFLKVFGCMCFPCLRPYNKHKLQFRTQPCTFLGYYNQYKDYKCLAPDGRVYVSRNVTFNEHSFPFAYSTYIEIDKPSTQQFQHFLST